MESMKAMATRVCDWTRPPLRTVRPSAQQPTWIGVLLFAALAAAGCSPVERDPLGKTSEELITIQKFGALGTSFFGSDGPLFSLGGRTIITEYLEIFRISPAPEHAYALDGELPPVSGMPSNLQPSHRISAHGDFIARGVTAGTEGTVEVWQRSSAGWSLSTKLSSPDASIDDRFGYHVLAAPGRIAVGAPRSDVALTDAGAVYIFDLVGTAWQHTATLVSPNPVAGEGLVLTALHGDVVAATAGDQRAILFQRVGCKWISVPSPEPPPGSNVRGPVIISVHGNVALGRVSTTTPDQHYRVALRSYRRESVGWIDEGEIQAITSNDIISFVWLIGELGPGVVAVGGGYAVDDAEPGYVVLYERTTTGFDTANGFAPPLSSDPPSFVGMDVEVADDLVAWNEPGYGVIVARFSTSTDAGTPPSLPADAGCGSADAGSDSSPDADGDAASSVPTDSGDAADSADSNASRDSGTAPDARLGQPDAGPAAPDSGADESCGCRTANVARPAAPAIWLWVLALLGILLRKPMKTQRE
jgi:hypothetical protein